MLSREEANKLYEAVGGMVFVKGCACLKDWQRLQKSITELTEKPKRQIHAGDIYRDAEEQLREIETVINHKICESRCGYRYDEDGKYIGDCEKTDLDLSKRFKLVEIDDE
jgi:hypothetical protein